LHISSSAHTEEKLLPFFSDVHLHIVKTALSDQMFYLISKIVQFFSLKEIFSIL
jgi:predicted amidohydrolase YtcJ